MNFSDTSYFLVPKDEECVLNASGIGKTIDEPATTIRSWADKHGKYLYIKKINGRWTYTEASVEQFRFIKDLCRNKNFTHKQIEEHIKQHGFEFNKYDGGIVDPQNPLTFQALASALALENQKQLKQFMVDFVQYQESNNLELINSVKTEVEQTVQDQLDISMTKIKKELELQRQENKQLSEQLTSIQQELAVTQDLNTKMDNLKGLMEQRKKEAEEQEQNQGFFSKLFNKKK